MALLRSVPSTKKEQTTSNAKKARLISCIEKELFMKLHLESD